MATVLLLSRPAVGQEFFAPSTPFARPRTVVIAKAVSPANEPAPEKMFSRWIFKATRTLDGADINGDTIVAWGKEGQFHQDASYILYLYPDAGGGNLVRAVEATEAAIAQAEGQILKAGGKVEPKLRMWAFVGNWQKLVVVCVHIGGRLSLKYWDTQPGGREKLVLSYEGKLSQQQLDDLAHRLAVAPGVPSDRSEVGGSRGWRDDKGVPHIAVYYPDPVSNKWEAMEDIIIESKGEWRQPDPRDVKLLAEVKAYLADEYAKRHPYSHPATRATLQR